MTIEEAIKILDPETRRKTMREIPCFERIAADTEACRMAVSALRAQRAPAKLDRSRWEGCEICKNLICATCEFATCEYDEYPCDLCKGGSLHKKVSYCPNCGRPLTEDAWAELERRINGG